MSKQQTTAAQPPSSSGGKGGKPKTPPMKPSERAKQVVLRDGRALAYWEWLCPAWARAQDAGSAEEPLHTVLLFSGIPGSRLFSHPLVAKHEPLGIRLISVDRPGLGLSTPQPGRTILDMADDVEELLDQIGLERVSVIGYSAGGPYALATAFRLPHRVTRVAIVSSVSPRQAPKVYTGMPVTYRLAWFFAAHAPWLLGTIVRLSGSTARADPVAYHRQDVDAMPESDRPIATSPEVEAMFVESIVETFGREQDAVMAHEYGLWGKPWGFDLADIKAPVRVWHGAKDTGATLPMGQYIAARIGCDIVVDPEAGHMLYFTVFKDIIAGRGGDSASPPGAETDETPGNGGRAIAVPARATRAAATAAASRLLGAAVSLGDDDPQGAHGGLGGLDGADPFQTPHRVRRGAAAADVSLWPRTPAGGPKRPRSPVPAAAASNGVQVAAAPEAAAVAWSPSLETPAHVAATAAGDNVMSVLRRPPLQREFLSPSYASPAAALAPVLAASPLERPPPRLKRRLEIAAGAGAGAGALDLGAALFGSPPPPTPPQLPPPPAAARSSSASSLASSLDLFADAVLRPRQLPPPPATGSAGATPLAKHARQRAAPTPTPLVRRPRRVSAGADTAPPRISADWMLHATPKMRVEKRQRRSLPAALAAAAAAAHVSPGRHLLERSARSDSSLLRGASISSSTGDPTSPLGAFSRDGASDSAHIAPLPSTPRPPPASTTPHTTPSDPPALSPSRPFDSAAASSKSASSATDAVSIRPPSPDIIGLSGLAKGRQNPSLRREMSVRDLARAVVFGIAEVSEGDCDGGERRNTDKVGDNGGDRDTQTFSGSDQSSLKIASAPAVMSTVPTSPASPRSSQATTAPASPNALPSQDLIEASEATPRRSSPAKPAELPLDQTPVVAHARGNTHGPKSSPARSGTATATPSSRSRSVHLELDAADASDSDVTCSGTPRPSAASAAAKYTSHAVGGAVTPTAARTPPAERTPTAAHVRDIGSSQTAVSARHFRSSSFSSVIVVSLGGLGDPALKHVAADSAGGQWVDNGPFSDQPEPHPSQHVDGSDASGATPLLIQPTAAHLDLDDASDGPNHTEDAGRSVRPNLGYEDLDQDLLSSPQIHEEILLTQAIASPPSPSIVSQAVSAFISADADRQEPEVSVSTKASSMPSIPEAGEAAEPAAEPPPHRSHDAKDEQVQPGQDHAADPNVDHLHDLTRSQLVQILSLEHTDPATDEIDTVDTDDTVGTDTQAVEERPKHTADAAPDHAAAVDDLPHMPDAPMHLGLLSTQMLARIPLDAFLDDDDNDDGDKVEADLEPARSASDAHVRSSHPPLPTQAHRLPHQEQAALPSESRSKTHDVEADRRGGQQDTDARDPVSFTQQMVLAADDVVAAFELAEARAAAKSDPSRAEQATPRVSEDVSDSDDAHSIDDDLLRHVHLTTQHFSDDGRAGASPATSGEDLGDTFNRDKGGLRMGRAAHGLPAYVPPPVWQTPRAPPQPQHQLRRGQENGMPGFVFASGKRASVSREAQHIGAVLLLDDDDVAPVGTQLVRSRVDAAALVPGTVRPMILRDAAMATRPSQSDGNAPSAQRAAAQARIATQPFRTPFKTVEQPSAASAPQSAPPAMSGFTTGSGRPLAPPSSSALARGRRVMESAGPDPQLSGRCDDGPKTPAPPSGSESTPRTRTASFAPPSEASGFVGFTTAGGRSLPPPSEEARKRSEALMAQAEREANTAPMPMSETTASDARPADAATFSVGFTTGSGKKLAPPSKQAIRRSARILESLNAEDTENAENGVLHEPKVVAKNKAPATPAPPPTRTPLAPLQQSSSHWSTPSRSILRHKSVVSLGSLGRPASAVPAASSPQSMPLLMRNSPFKAPTIQTPAARRGLLHPNARDSLVAASPASGLAPSEHGARARESGFLATRHVHLPTAPLIDVASYLSNKIPLDAFFAATPWPTLAELRSWQIPEQVISTTATNAHAVCFDGSGVAEARQALLAAGARPNLATDAWVANHYSLIVWKLASLARRFPGVYATSWSFAGVVEQLKFRYEYEINGAHASAIKQIVQRDNTPSWHMVLCVSALLPDGMIEVTDGWYRIRAMLDDRLKFLVSRGSIAVGLKLRLHGAQLVGSEACAPLELTSSTYLKLHANGTQRAEWHAKLGFVPQQQHSPRSLKSLAQNGGNVVCVDVVVVRRYPIVFLERLPSGGTVVRSEREEAAAAAAWQNEHVHVCQKIAHELQQEGQGLHGYAGRAGQLSFADNVSKLANERHEPRNIRKHVRLLVCDYPPAGVAREHTRYALVTIWNEDDNYLLQFDEGKRFKFFQMSTNSREGSETLRLHTTHYSRHLSRPVDPARLASTRYTPRQLVLSDQLEGRRARDEVDMLGIVLVVSARDAGSATLAHRMHYQLLCTDAHQHLFVVEFKSSMRLGEMAPMAVLWFRNIEYVYFDSHFGAHKLRGSVFSQIKATGAMLPHGPGPRQELEAWAAANGALIEQMREAHASLLTDMASYSGRK
ncbi:hypothetical protein HK105_206720 [Polyrhizophydium stewartii]|uniref:AB hydrolase-1 domain-containing protein n=1 Tax=Polyrhizophydium stewartii TaxID=2732419 RepID=A0ABR4N2J6_9FUNG